MTADSDQGRRLFAARVDDRAIPDVTFADVPALPVGDIESYVRRPGFQHGGIGVAACWLGGARAVAGALVAGAGRRPLDARAAAHLGEVDMPGRWQI
ncbi:hypothetical protein [Streptomyces inhibens]|uniref:hypothetical protein n=1 Tax=Streptomyces inhibens TaxID=2293571 RepID=UPI001C6DE4D1|nr:hypothetical protein [Streptomyces inhibens]